MELHCRLIGKVKKLVLVDAAGYPKNSGHVSMEESPKGVS